MGRLDSRSSSTYPAHQVGNVIYSGELHHRYRY